MMKRLAFAATVLVAVAPPASAQDAAAGQKIFARCAVCHAVGPGAKIKVGPVLNGVVGRTPGTYEGFKYSPAMVEFGKSHTWDAETISAYIEAPMKVVPKNKMAFPGLKKPEERAAVVAYLSTFAADGSPAATQ